MGCRARDAPARGGEDWDGDEDDPAGEGAGGRRGSPRRPVERRVDERRPCEGGRDVRRRQWISSPCRSLVALGSGIYWSKESGSFG